MAAGPQRRPYHFLSIRPERHRWHTAAVASSSFYERVYAVVCQVPCGKVITYGEVARRAGSPLASRAAGYALNALDSGSDVPWWRVVNREGGISLRRGAGPRLQRDHLEAEDIVFSAEGRIDLGCYGWDGVGASGLGGQQ